MVVASPEQLTQSVVAAMERTPDPRLREIMTSLVRHLHGFVTEVGLTEDEFRTATALVNEIGKTTHDAHNEAVLMAGSLGVSSLVNLINNPERDGRRPSQSLLGPFWRMHSPPTENGGDLLRSPMPGPALFFEGRIINRDGEPVRDAEVDIWHCSPAGLYESQDASQADMNLRGKFMTDQAGRFWFRSVKPSGYPLPTDGLVGRMLARQGRHPNRPAHVHALAFREGYKTMISQIYIDGDPYLDDDVQFAVTGDLVGKLVQHDAPHPTAQDVATPWYSLNHTFVMERGKATLPVPPIK